MKKIMKKKFNDAMDLPEARNILVEFKKKKVLPDHDEVVHLGEACIKIFDGEHTFTVKELDELTENLSNDALHYISLIFTRRKEYNNCFIILMKSFDANLQGIILMWDWYRYISKELYLDSATL
jgi:hypothetical protein